MSSGPTHVHAYFGGVKEKDLGVVRIGQCVGLGNLLCTWGDALLYARREGLPMLWPTWAQASREAVKSGRTYTDLFSNDGSYVSGVKRASLLRAWRNGTGPVEAIGPKTPYNPRWTHGGDPVEDQRVISDALHAMVPPPTTRRVTACLPDDPFVAVHVRRGDFKNAVHHATDGAGRKVNQPIPIEWYAETVREALASSGCRRAVVVSDGTDDELAPLAAVDGVTVQREDALVDLMVASRARLLVASGSTFSQWMAYLGQMATWLHRDFSWCDALHMDPSSLCRR